MFVKIRREKYADIPLFVQSTSPSSRRPTSASSTPSTPTVPSPARSPSRSSPSNVRILMCSPPLHSRHELTPCSQPPSASSSPSTPTPGSPSPATSALLAPWPASRAPSCLAGSPSMSGASASGTQRGSGGSFGGWRTGMRIARLASKRKKGVYVERSTSMTKGREAKTKTKKRWKKAVCRWEADTNPMWRRPCAWL